MPQCIICTADTKFEGGLCYPCYKKDSKKNIKTKETSNEDTSGLSSQERYYRCNMLKGRIAETLIQELF